MTVSKSRTTVRLFILYYSNLIQRHTTDKYTHKALWPGEFIHFISWPDFPSDKNTFRFGAPSNDTVKGKPESKYFNHPVSFKPVEIIHLKSLDGIHAVQILFINKDNKNNLNEIIFATRYEGVLLISDSKVFSDRDTQTNFYGMKDNIRSEMVETALKNCGFFVSFRLLYIAKIIDPIAIE